MIVTAESFNPRFRPHPVRAHESLLDEMLEENVSAKMVTRNAPPIAFVVPEGCDSVELTYGPIDINPDVGCEDDLAQIVSVGEPKVSDPGNTDGTGLGMLLAPGSTLLVTVPWRAASFVGLPAKHLKVAVHARFFAAANPPATSIA